MNIEEAYNTIKKSVEAINTRPYATKAEYEKVECIKVLLTAYEKEKEKNKELDKENQGLFELYNFNDSTLLVKILKDYKAIIEKQQKEIEELKDTNKKLYEMGKQNAIQELINNNYISKGKIIAKVIEVKNRPVKDEFITATQGKLNTIIDIESLLD